MIREPPYYFTNISHSGAVPGFLHRLGRELPPDPGTKRMIFTTSRAEAATASAPRDRLEQYRLLPYVLRYGMVAQEWAEQLRPGAALWWIVIALIAIAALLR
jgi:hypothetical protein